MTQPNILKIASALITNTSGAFLTVRKKGSIYYMMAGGKIERGETPMQALQRELQEELDLVVNSQDIKALGTHQTQAANEANTLVQATIFHIEIEDRHFQPCAELEEVRWLTEEDYYQVPLAHLLLEFSLPLWLKNNKSQP